MVLFLGLRAELDAAIANAAELVDTAELKTVSQDSLIWIKGDIVDAQLRHLTLTNTVT